MKVKYLDESDILLSFNLIYEEYDKKDDRVPNYLKEKRGLDHLVKILERSQMHYYPTMIDKVAFLFTGINQGHYFSNGNKRLAIVIAITFLIKNNRMIRKYQKATFKKKLKQLFPEVNKIEDDKSFTPLDLVFYNLALFVANHDEYKLSHDDVRERVKEFITFSLKK